jgi:hypothetical protein
MVVVVASFIQLAQLALRNNTAYRRLKACGYQRNYELRLSLMHNSTLHSS